MDIIALIADEEPIDLAGLSDEDVAGFRGFTSNLLAREAGLPHELTPMEERFAESGERIAEQAIGRG